MTERADNLNLSWLANIGAIITIAASAVDPFSQQIIQSQPCLWPVAGATAGIPKTQKFGAGIFSPSIKPRITGSMQAAIYMSLLSPLQNSSAAVTANCRTGNCTFPDDGATFSTLAICQSCVDISDTITYNTSHAYAHKPATIPSGAHVDGYYTMFESLESSGWFSEKTIFAFEALMSRNVTNDTNVDDFAIACGITPCLKTFAANITDTIYQETELLSKDLV